MHTWYVIRRYKWNDECNPCKKKSVIKMDGYRESFSRRIYTFGIFFLSSKPEKKTIFFTHCTKLEPNLLFLFWIMHQTNKLGALSKRDALYFRCGGWWHIHPGQILAIPFQNGPQFQFIGRSLGIYGGFCFKSLNTYHVCHIFDNSCCLLCFFHLYHYCH